MNRHRINFVVTLRDEGKPAEGEPPPYSRLKVFLKRALRSYGLRAVDVKLVTTPATTPVDSEKPRFQAKNGTSGEKPRF